MQSVTMAQLCGRFNNAVSDNGTVAAIVTAVRNQSMAMLQLLCGSFKNAVNDNGTQLLFCGSFKMAVTDDESVVSV